VDFAHRRALARYARMLPHPIKKRIIRRFRQLLKHELLSKLKALTKKKNLHIKAALT
jgi:hypothetical protein